MAYTLGELRALIADLDSLSDDVEVRLATQPSYPFENSISQAKLVNPSQADIDHVREALTSGTLTEEEKTEARQCLAEYEATPSVLYFCEGHQIGYASQSLWDQD